MCTFMFVFVSWVKKIIIISLIIDLKDKHIELKAQTSKFPESHHVFLHIICFSLILQIYIFIHFISKLTAETLFHSPAGDVYL